MSKFYRHVAFGVAARCNGPEFGRLLCDRHRVALNKLFDCANSRRAADLRIILELDVWGSFSGESLQRHRMRRRYYANSKDGPWAVVTMPLTKEEILLGEVDFRHLLAHRLTAGCQYLLALPKLRQDVSDTAAVEHSMATVLANYQSLPLPLPPTPSETDPRANYIPKGYTSIQEWWQDKWDAFRATSPGDSEAKEFERQLLRELHPEQGGV